MTAYKKDLASVVAAKIPGLPTEDVKSAIDLIFEYLTKELKKDNRIEIRGFGSFSLRDRAKHKMYLAKNEDKEKTYKTLYFRGTKTKQNLS